MNETLIIIPARSGSKRIKNKNTRIINGKPLVYWSIKYAKKYSKNEDIIVSSDSNIIGKISLKEKVKFIKRPKNISGDKSSVYFTLIHVLRKISIKSKYKYIALLQPTSPLRPKNIIFNGIKLLKKNRKFQNLVHLEKTNYHLGSVTRQNEWKPINKNIIRGQEIVNQFRPSGCLFIYSIKNFDKHNDFLKRRTYGFVSKKYFETVNIDTEEDFIKLNLLLKKNPKILMY